MSSNDPAEHTLATIRVGHLPELFEHIVSFLDNGTLASMARVSKAASTSALAVLWSELEELRPLLRLFHPEVLVDLEPGHPDPVVVERNRDFEVSATSKLPYTLMLKARFQTNMALIQMPPTEWKWDRFRLYASRVKGLTFDDEKDGTYASFCSQLALVWPQYSSLPETLLPNLKALTWGPERSYHSIQQEVVYLTLLLTSRLEKLVVRVPSGVIQSDPFERFVSDFSHLMIQRCSGLRSLRVELGTMHPASEVDIYIIDLIRGLPNLEEIYLPAYWGTSAILEAMSLRPKIKAIHAVTTEWSGRGAPEDVLLVQVTSPRHTAFRALTGLSLCITFSDLLEMLGKLTAVHLVHLCVQTCCPREDAQDVSTFLWRLTETQRNLRELLLELRDPFTHPRESERLGLEDLAPIHGFNDIRVFEIYCGLPLSLTEEELGKLLSGLPKLTQLQLNPGPLNDQLQRPLYWEFPGTLLTLDALKIVARSCPDMEVLGLYVSYNNLKHTSVENLSAPPRLLLYNMGTSPLEIDDSETLATVLFDVLPSACELSWGYVFPVPSAINWQNFLQRFERACDVTEHAFRVVNHPQLLLFNSQNSFAYSHVDSCSARRKSNVTRYNDSNLNFKRSA
jgi:hypothetical protein